MHFGRSAVILAVLAAAPAFGGTVVVSAGNTAAANWYWYNDGNDTFTGSDTITAAQTPPGSLTGSVDMSTTASNPKPLVFTTDFASLNLASLTGLSYETYSASGTAGGQLLMPNLQINLGNSATDSTYRGRLVYDPLLTAAGAAVTQDTWTTWDAFNSVGGWYFSKAGEAAAEGSPGCSLTTSCSLADILLNSGDSLYVSTAFSTLGFRTGGRSVDEVSYVDQLTVTTAASSTTYDFVTPEPSTWALSLLSLAGLAFVTRKRILQ